MTSYVYDEGGRLLRTVARGGWAEEDRALVLAYRLWKTTMCPRCGEPKAHAWHWDNEGFYELDEDHEITCWSCTAIQGDSEKPVTFPRVLYTRDLDARPLPPFEMPAGPRNPNRQPDGGGPRDRERPVGDSQA